MKEDLDEAIIERLCKVPSFILSANGLFKAVARKNEFPRTSEKSGEEINLRELASVFLFFSIIFIFYSLYLFFKLRYHRNDIKSLKNKIHELEVVIINSSLPTFDEMMNYYSYLREEVEREDKVTHQRLTWALAAQGGLLALMGILIGFNWEGGTAIVVFRKLALAGAPLIGLAFGVMAHQGLWASRTSMRDLRDQWEIKNKAFKLYPKAVPQAYGQGRIFNAGSEYAMAMGKLFVLIWFVIIALEVVFVSMYAFPKCISDPSILKCMFTDAGDKILDPISEFQ